MPNGAAVRGGCRQSDPTACMPNGAAGRVQMEASACMRAMAMRGAPPEVRLCPGPMSRATLAGCPGRAAYNCLTLASASLTRARVQGQGHCLCPLSRAAPIAS
eukprot:364453-Chlamydomonas_euryale.AAC.8